MHTGTIDNYVHRYDLYLHQYSKPFYVYIYFFFPVQNGGIPKVPVLVAKCVSLPYVETSGCNSIPFDLGPIRYLERRTARALSLANFVTRAKPEPWPLHFGEFLLMAKPPSL